MHGALHHPSNSKQHHCSSVRWTYSSPYPAIEIGNPDLRMTSSQTELWYEWRGELHWLQRSDDVPPNVIAMATELDAQLTKLTGQHWTQSLHQLIARPGWALVEEQIDRLLRADEA